MRAFAHSLTHPLTHACTHSLTHACTHSLSHSHTHSLTHSCTHACTHSLTHACTHSLSHSHTHSLTHSLKGCKLLLSGALAKLVLTTMTCMCITAYLQQQLHAHLHNLGLWTCDLKPKDLITLCTAIGLLQTDAVPHPPCKAVMQISAAFSAGSAIAVLGGGLLFCRYTGAGRRNFITGLTILASACFFVLTKYATAPHQHYPYSRSTVNKHVCAPLNKDRHSTS